MGYGKSSWERMLRLFCACLIGVALVSCKKSSQGKATASSQKGKQTASQKTSSKSGQAAQDPLGGMRLSSESDPSAMVVDVNGTVLTEGEVEQQLKKWTRGRTLPPEQLEQLRSQMVDVFISETVMLQEGEKQKIEVNDQDVENALEQMRENMSQRLPEGVSFEDALEQRGTSLKELRKDPSFLRQVNLKKILRVQTEHLSDPTEEEIQARYDENLDRFKRGETVHARHILVKCEKDAEPSVREEKKKEAEEIRDKLVKGEDFATLAQERSDCPSKKKGGDLGTFRRGQMVKPFEEAAFTQKVNEIGPVVETAFGYHLIEVLEHQEERTLPLEEVRDGIVTSLEREASEPVVRKFIEDLKSKAIIAYGKGYENLAPEAKKAAEAEKDPKLQE